MLIRCDENLPHLGVPSRKRSRFGCSARQSGSVSIEGTPILYLVAAARDRGTILRVYPEEMMIRNPRNFESGGSTFERDASVLREEYEFEHLVQSMDFIDTLRFISERAVLPKPPLHGFLQMLPHTRHHMILARLLTTLERMLDEEVRAHF